MGTSAQELQGAPAAADRRGGKVVAFDFDGTLTVRDSFNAFLVWRTPLPKLLAGLARLLPAALRYLADRDRGRFKAAVVRVFLRGVELPRLQAEARAFAESAADRLFRPDALGAWRRHQAQGATMVIVSASPEPLLAPFAAKLGADRLLATALNTDADQRITGRLDGPNCRGAEKVERLRAAFGPDLRLSHAYGDTSGDREMLAIADHPGMRVFTGRPARAQAR